ncbi:CATRA system-associated protein [Streptomyces sp. JB150]|uniref:CATRA system-associated protein n=1 Tax=Streptomyces sp. JB150 TaxID=2714844 RepID=UPI00140D693C|nr:CATRA system-associated protein [Streptomyces sp. JB150]QIJ64438.1 hypothetical protein G7Z13_22330 [Streptomyces sp. JB150]
MNDDRWARAAEDALTVLELLPDMEATPQEWARVEQLLATAVETAADRRDAEALTAAIREVKDLTGAYHGPARLPEQPPQPPGPPVLDRIPKLVQKIGRLLPGSDA